MWTKKTLTEDFLAECKRHLNITWNENGQEHRLFLAYLLYLHNDCPNEFDQAYGREILQVRHKYEVKQYAERIQTGG